GGRNFRNIHYLNSRNSFFTGCKQDSATNAGKTEFSQQYTGKLLPIDPLPRTGSVRSLAAEPSEQTCLSRSSLTPLSHFIIGRAQPIPQQNSPISCPESPGPASTETLTSYGHCTYLFIKHNGISATLN
ncbi:hypothetical protein, partial [uncultured Gimesia sp.]|uniref:hypothetical protein n=1 Tax=uncultured Gimesia sp. TaxID=1678688 RepID=UPI00263555F7